MRTKLEPGRVYKATIRGVPNQTILVDDNGSAVTPASVDSYFTDTERLSDARPLVVLDISPANALRLAKILRDRAAIADPSALATDVLLYVAASIEEQTPPPRITEPGIWGVVKAAWRNGSERAVWTRDEDGLWFYGPVKEDWDNLIDPVLIREGLS